LSSRTRITIPLELPFLTASSTIRMSSWSRRRLQIYNPQYLLPGLSSRKKIIPGSGPLPGAHSVSERLRALEDLKNDGLINEEEYNSKRREILGEL
jgi:hypothetical protein